MQANRSKDTKPELEIRRLVHALGYRFRLHRRDLPGCPDIVFTGRKKVIEIRGCFWHGHGCAPLGLLPRTRPEYWLTKITGNRERDARNVMALRASGWDVLEVWECRIRKRDEDLKEELIKFLGPSNRISRLRIQDHLRGVARTECLIEDVDGLGGHTAGE